MSRVDRWINLALGLLWWVLLLWGFFARDPWLFGPAAFFILLRAVDDL